MKVPLLIGNNFAVLVGAYELARRGIRVNLLTDNKPLGGHFAGIHIGGRDFDVGMVMLEKRMQDSSSSDLRTYGASMRNDWTRFGGMAARWLDEQENLRRVPTPTCLVRGRIVPDYLISNRLDVFVGGDVSGPAPLSCDDEHHASHKTTSTAYDALSYAEAAKLNHGEALHARFIEPYIRKSLGVTSNSFLARYHRAAWVPLYYPETLSGALAGEPTLAEYPFWTTHNGFVGQLVKNLLGELENQTNVTLVDRTVISLQWEGGQWNAAVDGGEMWSGEQLALGLTPARAHALLGTTPPVHGLSASVTLLFAIVRANAIGRAHGCLMVVDEDYAAYRLTDQDTLAGINPEWHRVVVEVRTEQLAKQYPQLDAEAALEKELRLLMAVDSEDGNAVQVLKCIAVPNALGLPTVSVVTELRSANASFSEVTRGAALTGGLLGYGVSSFNDQLIQGLKIAEEFSGR
ncbi:MAG TPA: hypothetical protein DCK83_04390 [Gallionellaceae bacterium]|nr:hypothetical protein [Gallionellaceae bacterium]